LALLEVVLSLYREVIAPFTIKGGRSI